MNYRLLFLSIASFVIAIFLFIIKSRLDVKYNAKKYKPKKKVPGLNYWKLPFSPIYLSIVLLILAWHWPNIFYEQPKFNNGTFNDWPRFWWCIAASCFGFAVIITRAIYSKDIRFPWTYLLYYPIIIFNGASLIYVFCNLWEQTSGYLFYFLAASLSFLVGYLSDKFYDFLLEYLKKKY